MLAGDLFLGSIAFSDFEIPECIQWGGTQRVAIHQLPDGQRVIDALGRNDTEICWSGVFSGPDASDRARLLDFMRGEGAVWPLTWDAFFYSVVITYFSAEFARPNWIPYRIACTVLRDEAGLLQEVTAPISFGIQSDLASADGFGTGVDLSGATASLTPTDATTRDTTNYTVASTSLSSAANSIDSQITVTEAELPQYSFATPTSFDAATNAAGQIAALTAARGYVRRAQVNLQNSST